MNYSNLMDAVNARIKANGRREITGDILNDVLRAMVVELGAGYQLGGTIRQGDKPKDEDLRVAYLAVEPGMYLYAGGFEVTELSLITYGAEWHMYPLGVPFGTQIAEDIAAAVEAEKTRAMAAEKALNDVIDTEKTERAAADSALDTAIKAEAKRATDAEGANASAITAEADARAKADTTLQGNITAEATAREAADEALAAKVTAEETARKAADATLQANINTEESERKAADQTLQANIEKKIFYIDYTRSVENIYSSNVKGIDVANAVRNKNIILLRRDDGLVSFPSTVDVKVDYIDIYWNDGPNDEGVWACVEFIWNGLNSLPEITEYENLIWSQKQDTISDLDAIRANAAHGQTAFNWGDHAKAGYTKAFIISISEGGSPENPYAVDKTREEVAAALAANSLILLKAVIDGATEIYPLIWATDYPTQGIILQFGNFDKASLIYTTILLMFSYQEGVGVNVTTSDIKLATDEQVKAKQDTLASGKNIKTINGESILGAGDLKVIGLPTIKAGHGTNSEVFNGIPAGHAYGKGSHAEGDGSVAMDESTGTYAFGDYSHAEGRGEAFGNYSHAEGLYTKAARQNSHAEGQYNVQDDAAIHSVGMGESNTARKDAHRITYDGKHYIIGIGGFDGTKATENLTNEKDLATVINGYETRIAALETALASIKSN